MAKSEVRRTRCELERRSRALPSQVNSPFEVRNSHSSFLQGDLANFDVRKDVVPVFRQMIKRNLEAG